MLTVAYEKSEIRYVILPVTTRPRPVVSYGPLFGAIGVLLCAGVAQAAEIKVMNSGGFAAAYRELEPNHNTSASYLYVDDANGLFEEWSRAGVGGRLHEPVDTDYGLREFAHVDPNGNLLRVGSPMKRA
jgi:predicted enzyme related to lactoylglutathione lyase